MNRKEAIQVIEENRIHYRDWNQEEFDKAIEKLKEPITLSDLLGWEEEVEYEYDDIRYQIENGKLFYFINLFDEWHQVDYSWSDTNIKNLQQATKGKTSRKDELLDELNKLAASERINEIIEELRGLKDE